MPSIDTYESEVTAMERYLVRICVVVGIVAGMVAPAFAEEPPQEPSQESAQQKRDERTKSVGSVVEDAALGVTSVAVSAGQIPVRAAACGATVVVAGLAYLLTVFDREARQGPARAIEQVCDGPYVTSPQDLRGE